MKSETEERHILLGRCDVSCREGSWICRSDPVRCPLGDVLVLQLMGSSRDVSLVALSLRHCEQAKGLLWVVLLKFSQQEIEWVHWYEIPYREEP